MLKDGAHLPNSLIYDNACALRLHWNKVYDTEYLLKTEFTSKLYNLVLALDHFHRKGHVRPICKKLPGRRFRLLDPEGTCRKETEKTLDPARIHRKMEAVFQPENFWIFFGAFRLLSCAFRQEPVGNHRKKFRKFSGRNPASMFR